MGLHCECKLRVLLEVLVRPRPCPFLTQGGVKTLKGNVKQ